MMWLFVWILLTNKVGGFIQTFSPFAEERLRTSLIVFSLAQQFHRVAGVNECNRLVMSTASSSLSFLESCCMSLSTCFTGLIQIKIRRPLVEDGGTREIDRYSPLLAFRVPISHCSDCGSPPPANINDYIVNLEAASYGGSPWRNRY
jgi:hypothetical protein